VNNAQRSEVPNPPADRALRHLRQAEVDLLKAVNIRTDPGLGLMLEAHAFIWQAISLLDRADSSPADVEVRDANDAFAALRCEQHSPSLPYARPSRKDTQPLGRTAVFGDTAMERDAETAAMVAGFKKMPLSEAFRGVFVRGASTLIVHSDGQWACFVQVCGGWRPERCGDDLSSLLGFLLSEAEAFCT
jgi:hypothetical protein